MKNDLPLINISSLNDDEYEIYQALDQEAFAMELANKVVEKLFNTMDGLYFSHRDYCGVGIYVVEDIIVIGEVNDGMGPHPIFISFDNQVEFTDWLSRQSDQSMSLCTRSSFNNQTITKIRLEYFLQADYSSNWNSYCMYLAKDRK